MSGFEGCPEVTRTENDVYNFNENSEDDELIQVFKHNKILNGVPSTRSSQLEKSENEESKNTEEIKNHAITDKLDTYSSDDGHEIKSEVEESLTSTEEIVNSKKTKKMIEEEYYYVEVGKATVISEPISDERKIMKGNLIETILENLLISWQCYCPFELNTRQCKYSDGCTMYGRCLHSAHNAKFMIKIIEIDTNIFTFTCYSNANGHPECQNNKREPLCNQNYKFEILNTENFETRPESKTQLTDIHDLTELWIEESKKPDGFLRNVSLPLSVVMYTKKQLKVVDKARSANIVHLDATGSYVRYLQGLKKKHIFYYALVYRASVSTIPLCEAITSEHDTTSISTILKQYRGFVMSVENKWPYFHAIVVDWSWASMHSILKEWNDTNINEYLDATYSYLTNGSGMKPCTLLLSCCAHVMHRISKTVEKEYPKLENNKGLVMELMALMVMTRNLEEMDILFEFIVTVFQEKNQSTCQNLIEDFFEKKKIDGEKTKKLLKNFVDTKHNNDTEMSWEEFARLFKKNPSIYVKSPFYRRYFLLLENIKDRICTKTSEKITSGLYCPQFFYYLLTTFMPYCPLWTAMMMDLIDPEMSRISNVYAESHMKNHKYEVLKNKRNWKIGKVCRALHENNENLVKEDTLSKCEMGKKMKGTQYDLYRKITEDSLDGLMWSRKIESDESKPRKVRKRKTRHMSGKKIMKLTEEPKENEKKYTPLKTIPVTKKRKRQKKNAANDLSIGDSELHKLLLLKNGLVNDVSYYANTKSQTIVIAHYYPTTRNFILERDIKLTGKQLRNLLYRRGSIDAETIDIFGAMTADKCIDVSYLSTEVAHLVMNSNKEINKNTKGKYYNLKNRFCSRILIPYCDEEHWMLLVVNETEKSLEILDPYDRTNSSRKILKALTAYMNINSDESNKKSSITIDWTVKKSRNRLLQKLTDKCNSATYIMYYAQCIGQNEELNENFDPANYRETIIHFIMQHSMGVDENCLYCFEKIDTEHDIACTMCQRLIHENCRRLDEMDTEDEEKLEFYEPPKTKKRCKRIGKNFKCRLCRRYELP